MNDQQQWTTRDGRRLTVTEDSPGIVKVTTEALEGLLRAAGMERVEDDMPKQVLRDERGRCQECGRPPAEMHREDCPHYRGQVSPRNAPEFVPPYEIRPAMPGDVERR